MRKIKLYIAISLDGKIAKPDGDISWLDELPNPVHLDYGYADFLSSIDTTLMGNNTYKQLLGFGIDFPYRGKENYVFTRNSELIEDENVTFISHDPATFVNDLKSGEGGDIWLIGGGEVNTLLLNEKLIDEFIIFIIPIVLGEGIPLFGLTPVEGKLSMIMSKTYGNGVVEIKYNVNND
jgi:dihydrofolate reductase